MKTLLLLFLLSGSLLAQQPAQPVSSDSLNHSQETSSARLTADTLRPIRTDTLKLVGTELIPYYTRYGRGYKPRYTYDGIDVRRPMDLEKYIRASGDPDAIAAFNRYVTRRKSGIPLLIIGSSAYLAGLIGVAVAKDNDPNRHTITYSTGTYPYTRTASVSSRGAGGIVVALAGAVLGFYGIILRRPGDNVRQAVQYYNRALRQRGVSWQVQPYSSGSPVGVGLVGRF